MCLLPVGSGDKGGQSGLLSEPRSPGWGQDAAQERSTGKGVDVSPGTLPRASVRHQCRLPGGAGIGLSCEDTAGRSLDEGGTEGKSCRSEGGGPLEIWKEAWGGQPGGEESRAGDGALSGLGHLRPSSPPLPACLVLAS